jgi:hypothetical protein
MSVPKRARQGGMPSKQLNKIQIHLSDNRSDTAVFQSVNVPTRLGDWSVVSGHASCGRQPTVLCKNAANRVAVEPTFLRNEEKIRTQVGWPLIQPGPQGRNFVHARSSSHPKEGLRSLQRPLEALNCDFHVAPINVAESERNQFARPKSVLKANDQQGVISSAPSSSSFEHIEQFIFAQMLERV